MSKSTEPVLKDRQFNINPTDSMRINAYSGNLLVSWLVGHQAAAAMTRG